MVVRGFDPYHRLWQGGNLTKRTGVIPTPWVMPLALGFWRNPSGGQMARDTTTTTKMQLFKRMLSYRITPCLLHLII
jgi:hypothetical protein